MSRGRIPLEALLEEARACRHCEPHLPLGPRPVLRAGATARLLIIGQAPGTRVHASGVPWDDPSGERLRAWLALDGATFYDPSRVAIIPMGLCYPGKGKGGDLPPRPECAPLWHSRLLAELPALRLTLLIGQYAQRHYLPVWHGSLSANVERFREFLPGYFPLPHPSPRNRRWLAQRPWFEEQVVPVLRDRVARALSGA